MADLSKLRFNGTDYNVKDASAPLRKFTSYSKTGNLPITSDDTTQTAIGKLENALDNKINTSAKGTANGVAELDANGKVPSSQLPSYVDDVLEYSAKSSFPATGETGKIYVDTATNKTYRWSGSAYVEISESLALGETSSTAYRGDRGKTAYDHSQASGNPHGTTGANMNLTGYSKGSSTAAVAATDTINAAIAKHENRINANQTNILSLQSRMSDAETDIDTQTARIDAIVALPSGSTQGDAELMDIRVKADGTTASSAGDAVREQISEVKDDLNVFVRNNGKTNEVVIANAFDNHSYTSGKYISFDANENETYETNENFCYSDYIDIRSGLIFNTANIGNNLAVFYDENKEVVDHGAMSSYHGETLPLNVCYLRFNFSASNVGNVIVQVKKTYTCIDAEQITDLFSAVEKYSVTSYGEPIAPTNYESLFNDVNSIEHNKIYSVRFAPTAEQIANLPEHGKNFFLLDLTDGYESTTIIQTYIRSDMSAIYQRAKWGSSWTEWNLLYNANATVDNLYKSNYSSVSIFDKIGVIGDSFASGEIYLNGSGHDYYELSWLQLLAKDKGVVGINFSEGGLSTRTWLTSSNGLSKLNNSDKCGLYFCNLGINDSGKLGYGYLGTINDIHDEDPSLNADTFYGNYGKIISAIMQKSPNSKIVLCTMPFDNDSHQKAYNAAIVAIANHYGLPYIESHKLNYFKSNYFQNGLVSGHPTAVMYAGMANAYDMAFSEVTILYQSYFADYIGVQ